MGGPVSSVGENWQKIRDRLARAGAPETVVVGVTKGQPLERVKAAVEAGVGILGDNYVQEGARHREQLPDFKGEWHFIGHIQSRKARDLITYHCVESLDRMSVAEELNRRAGEAGKKIGVFAEVNVGEELSKSGIRPGELEPFLDSLKALPNLELRGLMALPPPLEPVEARRPHFKKMRQLFDRFAPSHGLRWLSLGTSDDFVEAVEEGANLIRLGTVLFGPRLPK
jgi:PLP dependent protein